MTWRSQVPSRRNRSQWTAYERSRQGRGFDYDGLSDQTGRALLLNIPTDWDDITLLSGIGNSES